jgi:hypothetical protein
MRRVVLGRRAENRAEGLSGGARKWSYVKREWTAGSREDKQNASGKSQVA